MMNMAVARIVLRYVAMGLFTTGFWGEEIAEQISTDPDILMIVGVLIGIGVETFYKLAKKNGWTT